MTGFSLGSGLAISGPATVTASASVIVGGLAATAARDPFYEPGPLRVYVMPQPPSPAMKGLRAWGQPGATWGQPGAAFTGEVAEEPHQPRPLNALGARLATVALRMGLARLLEIHPRTDTGRRWGVVRMPTKAERQQAALQAMREDAMIAKAVESMREPPEDVEALGARLAKLDDNASHITDK